MLTDAVSGETPVLTAASAASARSALACESMLSLATQVWHSYPLLLRHSKCAENKLLRGLAQYHNPYISKPIVLSTSSSDYSNAFESTLLSQRP